MTDTTHRFEASTEDYESLYGTPRPAPPPPRFQPTPRRPPSLRTAQEVVKLLAWIAVLIFLAGTDIIIWAALLKGAI